MGDMGRKPRKTKVLQIGWAGRQNLSGPCLSILPPSNPPYLPYGVIFDFCTDFYRFYKIPILIPINPFKGAIGPWWPPREIWQLPVAAAILPAPNPLRVAAAT